MENSGMCCGSLDDEKGLMKMGLSMVLVGHVNFLLGALVHGVVLRHFSLQKQTQALESAISNVLALAAGLVGVIVGIMTIVLSKNRKNRVLTWSLFTLSALASLVAAASVIGLTVSLVKTVIQGDKSLLTYCGYSDDMSYSSTANECPFDPTRIYSTTIVLWVPLILMSAVEMVFSSRLFKVSIPYLGLPCCLHKQPQPQDQDRLMKTQSAPEPRYAPPPRCCHGDEEQMLSERPPEIPCDSRQHRSTTWSAQCHQHSFQFNRGALERSSIWI